MRSTRLLAVLTALAVAAGGCATGRGAVSPLGREVTAVPAAKTPELQQVKGELLAVDQDRLWVREQGEVRELPLQALKEVRVRRHSFGRKAAMTWSLIGGLVTGVALAAACSSVEDTSGCGGLVPVSLGLFLGVGALSAPSLEDSSRILLRPPTSEALRPFSRLPQGLPEGINLRDLGRTPAEKASDVGPRTDPD
jgi:hypothetical protein